MNPQNEIPNDNVPPAQPLEQSPMSPSNDQIETPSEIQTEQPTPESSLSSATSTPKGRLPVKKIIIFATVILLVVVGTLIALAYFLPGKTLKDSFMIGDIEITKEKIAKYEEELAQYKKQYGVQLAEEVENNLPIHQIAENDLILNAGLKYYGKEKCNNTVLTERELAEAGTEDSGYALDPMIIRTENKLLKDKLNDCLIGKKDILEISASVASRNYTFGEMRQDEITKKFQSVKKYMDNIIAPLFQKGLSREEIIKQVDVYYNYSPNNPKDNNYWVFTDYSNGNYNKIVSKAPIIATYWQPWQGVDTCGKSTNTNNEKTVCENQIIQNLKVGETSSVFATSDDFYRIVRVEAASGGEFSSWADFIENLKSQYGYSKLSIISSTIKYFALASIDFVLGTDYASAHGRCPSCDGCYDIPFYFDLRAPNGDYLSGGGTFGLKQNAEYCTGIERWGLGFNQWQDGIINCGDRLPEISIGKGWQPFTSWTGTSVGNHCPTITSWTAYEKSWKTKYDLSIAGWQTSGPSTPWLPINTWDTGMGVICWYKPTSFIISVSSTVDKDNMAVGETATWTHTMGSNNDVRYDDGCFIGESNSTCGGWTDNILKPTGKIYQYIGTSKTPPVASGKSGYIMPDNTKTGCLIPDGDYKIKSMNDTNYEMFVVGGTQNGAIQVTNSKPQNQKWHFECDTSKGRGDYIIYNVNPGGGSNNQFLVPATGLVETLSSAGMNVWGTYPNEIDDPDADSGLRRWRVEKVPNTTNQYRIYMYNGLTLDIKNALPKTNPSSTAPFVVQLGRPNNDSASHNNQTWQLDPAPTERTSAYSTQYTLVNTNTVNQLGAGGYVLNGRTTTYTAQPGDAGKYVCQTVRSNWISRGNPNAVAASFTTGFRPKDSTPACVQIQNSWRIDLETKLEKTYAANELRPGDKIKFIHNAKQAGPGASDAIVNFSLPHPTAADSANSNQGAIGWTANTTTSPINNFASGRPVDANLVLVRTEEVTITQDYVGKYLCSQITATPGGSGSYADPRSSNMACIYIPYNYELIPDTDITTNGDAGTVNYDDDTRFRGKIHNNGPTKSKPTDWEAFIFVILNDSERKVPTEQLKSTRTNTLSNSEIATIYGLTSSLIRQYRTIGTRANSGSCVVHNGPTDGVFYPNGPSVTNEAIVCQTDNLIDIVNTLNLGDRLCFAIWVQPSYITPTNQNANLRSYSRPSCLTVSKSPQIQLRGADSKSGAIKFGETPLTSGNQGGFEGKPSSNVIRGSWSQYGLLATGTGDINGFGSTGYTMNTNNAPKFCKLLFANTSENGKTSDCPGTYGKMEMSPGRTITLPDEAEITSIPTNTPPANRLTNPTRIVTNLNGLASGTYYADKDLVITASTLASGQHLIIVVPDASHSVTIAGNIKPTSTTFSKLEDIPSLTVIARNINVQGVSTANGQPVTQIYGTYIAKERFNTCSYQYRADPDAWAAANYGSGDSVALAGVDSTPADDGTGLCRNQLIVTGAVVSKNRPNLLRTYGAGKDDVSAPSEIFKYTPNLYLTPYALSQTGNNNNWSLTDLRQLPGRI